MYNYNLKMLREKNKAANLSPDENLFLKLDNSFSHP